MAARRPEFTPADQMLFDAIADGSAVAQVVSVKELSKPSIDRTYQTRVDGEDIEHVRTLGQVLEVLGGRDLFPIVVIRKPGSAKRWRVLNGFHRLVLYIKLGRDGIPAYVVDWDEAKAWEYAVGCNLVTGKRTTPLDRKNAFLKLLAVNDNHLRSIRSTAALCGISEKLAKNTWLEFFRARGETPPAALLGSDDKPRIITPEPPKPTPLRTDPRLADDRREIPSPARGIDRPHDRKTCPMCNGTGTVPADTTN